MDYNAAFAISAAGMDVERARADVAALNLANASSTRAAGEAGFTPMRAVVRAAGGDSPFAAAMRAGAQASTTVRLPSVTLEPTGRAPRQVLEPGHPMADAAGFVTYPGVDPATEMMTMMSATRAYEANVAAMNTARTLALKALEIGGNS